MAGRPNGGWVKLWRKAEDTLIPQAGRFQLFAWLMVKAARLPMRATCAGRPDLFVDLAPGQLVLSTRSVASRLNRPRSTVQADLAWMVSQQMISAKPLEWGTLVTVLNWPLYQSDADAAAATPAPKADAAFIQAVREDLNQVLADHGVGRRVDGGKSFDRLVAARVSQDGATLEQFRHVHRVKAAEWAGTDQAIYLRPSTLYAPSHWADYRDQDAGTAGVWKPPTLSPGKQRQLPIERGDREP